MNCGTLRLSHYWSLAVFCGVACSFRGVEAEESKPWGEVVDPTGSCEIQQSETHVEITAPGGHYNLMVGTNQDAPRVLREISGDFKAVAKISGAFDPGQKSANGGSSFNGGGFLIWGGEENYLRFERDVWKWEGSDKENSYRPLVEYWRAGGSRSAIGYGSIPEYRDEGIWFEVSRVGNAFVLRASHDKEEWIDVGTLKTELPDPVQVGFSVVNSSIKPCAVKFSDISVSVSKGEEAPE